MTEPTIPPTPARARRWPRRLALVAGGLIVLLVAGYCIVTSAAFFKGVVLPRVSRALNAEVTVADASLSPFSRVTLQGLAVRGPDGRPVLQVERLELRYHLRRILGGRIEVNELAVTSPTLEVVQRADGTSNLDPLLNAAAAQPAAPPSSPRPPGEPLQLAVRAVSLKGGTLRLTREMAGGDRLDVALTDVGLTLDQLANGQPGTLNLGARCRLQQVQGTNQASLEAQSAGEFRFELGPDLLPRSISGRFSQQIDQATGALAHLAGSRAALACELTPAEIRQLSLQVFRADQLLGEAKLSGPLDIEKREGRVKLEIGPIDRQVLNLAGTLLNLDFGPTRLGSTLELELAQGGSLVAVKGRLETRPLRLTQSGRTTPSLDLTLDFSASADLTRQTGRLETLSLSGLQDQRPLLSGSLARPMALNWGGTEPAAGDSTLDVTVTRLNLADWRPFLAENVSDGGLDLRLNLAATRAGQDLRAELKGDLRDLTVQLGTNRLSAVNLNLQLAGRCEDFDRVNLESCALTLTRSNRTALTIAASGRYGVSSNDLTLNTRLEASLPSLLALASRPDLDVQSGTLQVDALYSQLGPRTNLSGSAQLNGFEGRSGAYAVQGFGGRLDYQVEMQGPLVRLPRLALALSQAGQPAGQLELSGQCDPGRGSAELTFAATQLNQHALGPLLAPALHPAQLASVSLHSRGKATLNPDGESSVQAELAVTNLVVKEAGQSHARPPLRAELSLDGVMRRNLLDLRQLALRLTPTDRARNELRLEGQLDLERTNAYSGTLRLSADSLDLTPYYDLTSARPEPAAKPAPPAPAESAPASEPEPIELPVQDIRLEARVDRLYLRELALSNWLAQATLQGSRFRVVTNRLILNGAPVSLRAELDLGRKGWAYDLALKSDRVPLEPLANTLSPETRGQYQGWLAGDAQIKGAGITDASLRSNLTARLDFSLTNANIQLLSERARRLLLPVATLLRVNDLTRSPLNWVWVQCEARDASIRLTRCEVQSDAFEARAQGTIPMAAILTNSPLNLPVEFALRHSLAQKAGLLPAQPARNTNYVNLPQFIVVKGTIGQPKTDLNELVISGLLLKSAVALPTAAGVKVDSQTSDLLKGLGNLLTGQNPAAPDTNQNTSTNRSATPPPGPATNAPLNPLDLLRPRSGK